MNDLKNKTLKLIIFNAKLFCLFFNHLKFFFDFLKGKNILLKLNGLKKLF